MTIAEIVGGSRDIEKPTVCLDGFAVRRHHPAERRFCPLQGARVVREHVTRALDRRQINLLTARRGHECGGHGGVGRGTLLVTCDTARCLGQGIGRLTPRAARRS